MINFELQADRGILVLHVEGPLGEDDFIALANQVDSYLSVHGTLHGVLIHAKSFPGWENLSAMTDHFKFIKAHAKDFEKIAIVADGALAKILPSIANQLVNVHVRHFDFEDLDMAWNWLDQPAKTTVE